MHCVFGLLSINGQTGLYLWLPIASVNLGCSPVHRFYFLGLLLVGTNHCIPGTPHKICCFGDALIFVIVAQIFPLVHISCFQHINFETWLFTCCLTPCSYSLQPINRYNAMVDLCIFPASTILLNLIHFVQIRGQEANFNLCDLYLFDSTLRFLLGFYLYVTTPVECVAPALLLQVKETASSLSSSCKELWRQYCLHPQLLEDRYCAAHISLPIKQAERVCNKF